MGTKRREEWNSNFICWLLDPTKNHGLGNFPLKIFLELINEKNKNTGKDKQIIIKNVNIDTMKFNTEEPIQHGRIDIYGENENFILIIENKIYSKEGWNSSLNKYQTELYFDYFENCDNSKMKQKCYVFLRPNEYQRPHSNAFVCITYQELFEQVICKCIDYSGITKEAKGVLEQYAMYISNPNMVENVLVHRSDDLVKKIYSNHKGAISEIRNSISNNDENPIAYNFFNKYKKYLNEILLSLKEVPITWGGAIKIKYDLKVLCDRGIVIPGETELVAKRNGYTYIIQVFYENGSYFCHSGYYDKGEYTGKEAVDIIDDKNGKNRFSSIQEASRAAEIACYKANHVKYDESKEINMGPPSGNFEILQNGKKLKDLF